MPRERPTTIRVYIEPRYLPMIDQMAKQQGMSRSSWVRKVLLDTALDSDGSTASGARELAHPLLPSRLCAPSDGKIVLLVMDGVGDLATADHDWKTPLEVATTPNLDALARRGALGLLSPAGVGITVGSVSGHIALWGYNPLRTVLGRGVVDALGVGVDVRDGDVLLRGNFATVGNDGMITDRRAGRPSDEEGARLCALLADKITEIDGVTVRVHPIKGHRFSLQLRGEGLSPAITDTDPQAIGVPFNVAMALDRGAESTARIVNKFFRRAVEALAKDGTAANSVLLRGAEGTPQIASFPEHYGLRSLALASYPTYRGVAKACGMQIGGAPEGIEEAMKMAARAVNSEDYDFVYVHHKATDQAGEDGDFEAKVQAIERFDAALATLIEALPADATLAVTADHSTPVALRKHGWQCVPVLVVSPWAGKPDKTARFTEASAKEGNLGMMNSVDLMPLLMAHAGRLRKIDGEGI